MRSVDGEIEFEKDAGEQNQGDGGWKRQRRLNGHPLQGSFAFLDEGEDHSVEHQKECVSRPLTRLATRLRKDMDQRLRNAAQGR